MFDIEMYDAVSNACSFSKSNRDFAEKIWHPLCRFLNRILRIIQEIDEPVKENH